MNNIALSFNNVNLDCIEKNQQVWVGATQIGLALGYVNPETAITKIYNRNQDEFSSSMTKIFEVSTNGGIQKMRMFNLRGAHLIAMFSRTKIAKQFRKWVLDILDKEITQPKPQPVLSTIADRVPLRNAITALVVKKDLSYPDAWHLVHQYIGCKAEEMTTEQVKQAIEYCHRLIFAEALFAKPTVEWERQYGLNISKEAQDALYDFYFNFRRIFNTLEKIYNHLKKALNQPFQNELDDLSRIENKAHDFLARFKIRDKDNALIKIMNYS